jgi:molecular chaperone GrpE
MVKKNEPQLATAPLAEETAGPQESVENREVALETRLAEVEEVLKSEKSRADDLFKRLQYLQADFENYRKRAEKEMGDAKRFGNERLLSDLLVVNDEMELALIKAGESGQSPAVVEGVGMVLKRLHSLLVKEGVERIPGVGSKFTPDLSEAALRVESADAEEGAIVEEIRPGYTLKGRVLRPSIVKVAEKQSTVEPERENQ